MSFHLVRVGGLAFPASPPPLQKQSLLRKERHFEYFWGKDVEVSAVKALPMSFPSPLSLSTI